VRRREFFQLTVNQRNDRIQRLLFPGMDALQQFGDVQALTSLSYSMAFWERIE
jgi:hypothetical protein